MGCGCQATVFMIGVVVLVLLALVCCVQAQTSSSSSSSSSTSTSTSTSSKCFGTGSKMINCQSFLMLSNVATPDATCCTVLAGMVTTDPICLCQHIKQIATDYVTKTSKLQQTCGVTLPCPGDAVPSSVPSPRAGNNNSQIVPGVAVPANASAPSEGHSNASNSQTVPATDVPVSVPTSSKRPTTSGLATVLKVVFGVFLAIGGLVLILVLIYWREFFLSHCIVICCWNDEKENSQKLIREEIESIALQSYKYADIEKMTNSFKEKLGQGAFGTVFKGKLEKKGHIVAVKVLNESMENGEDFLNEVETIGRIDHRYVVRLLGYCMGKTKRVLVYEFMPKGSLQSFITKSNPLKRTPLERERIYQIACGIAKGLEYLHSGCNKSILHLDIKPENILLNQDYRPKISDFGLSKLCKTSVDHVSNLGFRGTRGYMAPEIYDCYNDLGKASTAADVYSYGMVVLELVGGRMNSDATVKNPSERYFPMWIYNHLVQENTAEASENINVELLTEILEVETSKKMVKVALWCIQYNPTERPKMSGVVKMLEGSTEELSMPPNPFRGDIVQMMEGSTEEMSMPPNLFRADVQMMEGSTEQSMPPNPF